MIRDAILREMKRYRWSAYRLGQESGVPIRTVQDFVAGTSDLAGERLSKLCAALGLRIVRDKRRKVGVK